MSERLIRLLRIVVRGYMIGCNAKMIPELPLLKAKNDMKRLSGEKSARIFEIQAMSRGQGMLRGNQNDRARSEDTVVELPNRRPRVFVGFNYGIGG